MANHPLLIIGRGRMAQAVATLASERGIQVLGLLGRNDLSKLSDLAFAYPNLVVLELTQPTAAAANVEAALHLGLPVVCGTTGWDDERARTDALCLELHGAFLFASNFSPGMNLAFALAKQIGAMAERFPDYSLGITETHHTRKLDAPSGTAITLAEQTLANQSKLHGWQGTGAAARKQGGSQPYLPIDAMREGEVVGDHALTLQGPYETLTLHHHAQDRRAFAEGALAACQWIAGKHGVFGMEDVLGGDRASTT